MKKPREALQCANALDFSYFGLHHGLDDLCALAFAVRSRPITRRYQLPGVRSPHQHSACQYAADLSSVLPDREVSLENRTFAIGNFNEVAVGVAHINRQKIPRGTGAFYRSQFHRNAVSLEVTGQGRHRNGAQKT